MDFSLFMSLKLPSLIMVFLGYRYKDLSNVSYWQLLAVEFLSHLTFGCILLPLVYFLGLVLGNNSEKLFKNLGLLFFLVSNVFNMLVISIIQYISGTGSMCQSEDLWSVYASFLNPFTYAFLNPVLNYLIWDEFS